MLASASARILPPVLHPLMLRAPMLRAVPRDATAPPFPGIAHALVTVARDGEIFPEASPATHVYKVLSGTLRTAKLLADGRRQIGAFVFAGEWVGFDGGPRHFYAAEAVTEARLLRFSRRDLERLMAEDREAARTIRDMLCGTLAAAHERIVSLGRKTALERVASFLADIEEHLADDAKNGFVLPMSRGDIADYLGLTVETVSRILGDLRRRHVIRIEEAHHVRIIDPTLLRGLIPESHDATLAREAEEALWPEPQHGRQAAASGHRG